jgi:hypothetical protein
MIVKFDFFGREVKGIMEQIQENEQWKLNGNCEKCRRNNYCSKPCTHHKRRIRAEYKGLVADAMNKMTGGVMREVIDKTINGIW